MLLPLFATALLLLLPLVTLRLLYILPRNRLSGRKIHERQPDFPAHLLIVLGSGGHTAEMLSLIRNLDPSKYLYRTYVVSSGDSFSAGLARAFELDLSQNSAAVRSAPGNFTIVTVPRARKIHQSILTTPLSSLYCLLYCLKLLKFGPPASESSPLSNNHATWPPKDQTLAPRQTTPDLIVTNGPATGVIIVLASLILRFFSFSLLGSPSSSSSKSNQIAEESSRGEMRTIYVESWARVSRLSLSGRILLWITDRFIVQWERLMPATKGRGEYLGVLVE